MLFGLRRLLTFEDRFKQVGHSWFRWFFEASMMVGRSIERLFGRMLFGVIRQRLRSRSVSGTSGSFADSVEVVRSSSSLTRSARILNADILRRYEAYCLRRPTVEISSRYLEARYIWTRTASRSLRQKYAFFVWTTHRHRHRHRNKIAD